jgi:hypothetical protein
MPKYKHFLRIVVVACSALVLGSWGPRGHQAANRAAIRSLPANGPVFLKEHEEWIVQTGPLPDSWRGASEPYSKIFEDPNHGWFKEQFSFMEIVPRSRYEFVLRLHDEYLRIKDKDPVRARQTNVRWTGTLPYAAMENFDRMKSAMRLYRHLSADPSPEAKQKAEYLARDIAFYSGWLGHYTADGAQPLHDTIHHDGWQGPNPKNYTTDPKIHGRFESSFVELIKLTDADLAPLVSSPKVLDDPFQAIIDHLDDASTHVEQVYKLDQSGAFSQADNAEAASLAKNQLAKAASLLRDLIYTAWMQSAQPVTPGTREHNPVDPANPDYNPATGTAPPPGTTVRNTAR